MPSVTSTSLPGKENAALTFDVVLVVDAGRADDVLALRLVQLVPDSYDLVIGHQTAWDFVLAAAHIDLRVPVHGVCFLRCSTRY